MPQPLNHDNARHSHHPRTQNHRHEQLLMGWERVQLQNSETTPTPPPSQMEWQWTRWLEATGRWSDEGKKGKQWKEGGANKKKAQETSFDVSWAIGKFFFSSHIIILLLMNFLSIN